MTPWWKDIADAEIHVFRAILENKSGQSAQDCWLLLKSWQTWQHQTHVLPGQQLAGVGRLLQAERMVSTLPRPHHPYDLT